MSTPDTHSDAGHQHGSGCGHIAIKHQGHVDYLHDGHLHHPVGPSLVEGHVLDVSAQNPDRCTPDYHEGHEASHRHGPGCGHETVPHGDHIGYLVEGHLHHPHGEHCDDHGPVEVSQ